MAKACIEEIKADGEVRAVVARCGKRVVTLWWRKGYVPMPEHVDLVLFKWKKYRPVWYYDAAGDGHLLWARRKLLYNGVPKVGDKKYGSQWHLPHIMKKAFRKDMRQLVNLFFRAAMTGEDPPVAAFENMQSPQRLYLEILFRSKWSSTTIVELASPTSVLEGIKITAYKEKSSGFTAILITQSSPEPTSAMLVAKSPKLSESELLSIIQAGTKIRRIYNPAGIGNLYMSSIGIITDHRKGREILNGIRPSRIQKLFTELTREYDAFSPKTPRSILYTGGIVKFNRDGTTTSIMTTRTWSTSHVHVVTDSETRLHSGTLIRETLYDSEAEYHNQYLPPVEITWSGRPDKTLNSLVREFPSLK